MSGVIDDNGQQWEHCCSCGKFVKIQKLWYEKPSKQYQYGRDLCNACALASALEVAAPHEIKTAVIKL